MISPFLSKFRPPSLIDYARSKGATAHHYLGKLRHVALDADKHAEDVRKLFDETGSQREKGFQGSLGAEAARSHALVEIETLRLEIINIKDREVAHERFVGGAIAALSLVVFESTFSQQATTLIASFSVVVTLFGLVRFRENQRNIFEIDCYLRELEHVFRGDYGWVTFFFRKRRMPNYFASRFWFWVFLVVVSFSLVFVSGLNWLHELGVTEYNVDFLLKNKTD